MSGFPLLLTLFVCGCSLTFAVLIRNDGEKPFVVDRSFTVGKNAFLKDGQPFRYVSGSFHYWRQPPQYWEDTFQKMKAAGLNTVQTYINWALHEAEPGKYNFKGEVDIRRFFATAQKQGLLVILRPGPFIDAEVDFGGLPYWLLRENPNMQLRTTDPTFLHFVERWYKVLFPLVEDLLYRNGGPIITVQVENEYGSYGSDTTYKEYLRNLTVNLLGTDVVLFTTDGDGLGYVQGGYINNTLTTVDFGSGADVPGSFKIERMYNAEGPLVNSEFYPGWLDHWGETFVTVDYQDVVKTMKDMLDANASFNVYMFYGGTNFGFTAGSNLGSTLQPIITSYDYDAPLSEAGDTGSKKYSAVRDLLGQYLPLPPGPVPPSRPKSAYGKVQLAFKGTMYDVLDTVLNPDGPTVSTLPLTFEELYQAYGFVLYRTEITTRFTDPAVLSIPGLHDRAIVFVDKVPVTMLSRSAGIYTAPVVLPLGSVLDILVQNEGRICWGHAINTERKGILGNVTVNGHNLTNWEMFPFELPSFPNNRPRPLKLPQRTTTSEVSEKALWSQPAFYSGKFHVNVAQDTYLNMKGWRHGYAFINGRNLGRYWPVQGPQVTLYVPGVYLRAGKKNVLDVFELERAPCDKSDLGCTVEFIDYPILNATVPQSSFSKHKRPVFFRGTL